MLVKVGGITNLSDARYCAGMGVEMLGFGVIAGQDNYIAPERFQEIRGWVTGPRVVAEIFGIKSADALEEILKNYSPDYLELSMNEISLFQNLPLPFILSLKDGESSDNLPLTPAYIQRFTAVPPEDNYPILLEIRSAQDFQRVLQQAGIHGISMHGGQELRPGLKDYDFLSEVLEQLDADG